jgi:hypothetical protein
VEPESDILKGEICQNNFKAVKAFQEGLSRDGWMGFGPDYESSSGGMLPDRVACDCYEDGDIIDRAGKCVRYVRPDTPIEIDVTYLYNIKETQGAVRSANTIKPLVCIKSISIDDANSLFRIHKGMQEAAYDLAKQKANRATIEKDFIRSMRN